MSIELLIAIGILYYIVTIMSIVGVLSWMQNRDRKQIRNHIDDLERDKNLIVSANLIAEFNKVEPLIKDSDMKDVFSIWQKKSP